MNLRRSIALVVGLSLAVAVLAGCGASTRTVTWVGAVTTLTPHFCVGRHAALGECFTTDNSGPVANLQIGDCVVVTFSTNAAEGAEGGDMLLHLDSVARTDPAQHRVDCPETPTTS